VHKKEWKKASNPGILVDGRSINLILLKATSLLTI
jgi:hypothetical protein